MKANIKALIVLFIALVLNACESFIEGFEQDPNNPSDAPAEKMIEGIMLADMFVHTGDLNRLVGMWMHYFTGMDRQYVTLDNWAGSVAADFDNAWGIFYGGVIAQSRIVQDKCTVSNNIRLRGVAKILEAHALGTVTQLWGDVPNTQANKPNEYPNPAYDGQLTIYAYLQELLDEAITDLTGPGSIPNDLFLGGNAVRWSKFAHSLKARYYLHTEDWINAKNQANLGILNVSEEVWAPYGDVFGQNFNPYYDFLVYNRPGYMGADNAHCAELLDPYNLSGSGKYRGNAKTNEEARFNWMYLPYFEIYTLGYEPNYLNDFDWGYVDGKFGKRFPIFTAGETLLIIAESEIRLNNTNSAISAYNNYRAYLRGGGGGFHEYVTQLGYGFRYDDYVLADFEPGGMVNHGQPTAADAILYEIIEERYVALCGELEAFNDWRRTNNLINIPIKGSNPTYPRRLLYPQVEVNSNTSVPQPLPDFYTPTPVHQ